jgi:hypothetical protein
VLQPDGADVHVVLVWQIADGHTRFFQQLFVVAHFASQRHEAPQLTPPAHPPPEQSAEHTPGPHFTPVAQAFA